MNYLWIEKFNDEYSSLLERIGSAEQGIALSDFVMNHAAKDLMARSFDEFVQKCRPSVYLGVDYENGLVGCDTERSTVNQVFQCEAQRIFLYVEDGNFDQIDQWLRYVHAGKPVAMKWEERRDWFFMDMLKRDRGFTGSLRQLGDVESKESGLQLLLEKYDDAPFLVRRFLHRYELFQQGKLQFSLLHASAYGTPNPYHAFRAIGHSKSDGSFQSSGQLQSFSSMGYEELPSRTQEEVSRAKECLNDILNTAPIQHRELLYWNCMLEFGNETFYRSAELRSVYERMKDFYEMLLDAFWNSAVTMLHSMFRIRRHFEENDGFIFFTNCHAWEAERSAQYLRRFLETTNTKLYQEYRIDRAVICDVEKEGSSHAAVRERFKGSQILTKKQKNIYEIAMNLQALIRMYYVETEIRFAEEQTEDIYEFLSKD